MAEYTYADVIIDPNDPRVEIGKEYYFALGAQACIDYANRDVKLYILADIDTSGKYHPFIEDGEKDYPFIIRKKEPEKRYVPFDLDDPEDRNFLRDKWVRVLANEDGIEEEETLLTFRKVKGTWLATTSTAYLLFSGDSLLRHFTFIDGTPCGKLVEEDIYKEIADDDT